MDHKKRILVFPFNLLSHYLRCIVFVNKYYDTQLYEVLFVSSHQYNSYVIQAGFGVFNCDQFEPEKVMEFAANFDFNWLNLIDIETVFLAQRKAIVNLNPDLVIGDTAPALKMAAEVMGVKYISIMNGYMTKYYKYTRKLSRTHPAYKFSKKIPESIFDKITKIAERRAFVKVHKPFRELRKKYGLNEITTYLDELEGHQNFICDDPEVFPQKALPSHYRVIGPLIYNGQKPEGQWLAKIDKSRPIICITLGSSGNWKNLAFLGHSYYQKYTIITAGDTDKILSGPNIISRNFVNLDEVVAKSDLLICHGGNGTIYYGLLSGTYMLCVTSNFEQEWNVFALERLGYGASANEFSELEWQDVITKAINIKLKAFEGVKKHANN